MPDVKSTARIRWNGSIARGAGAISGDSGVLQGLPVSLPARLGEEGGKSTPEELLAAAEAACFTMNLGTLLARERTPPERLDGEAVCTLASSEGSRRIVSIELDVRVRAPGADQETLDRLASQAEQGCVVSRALAGNVEIRARATLEE